MHLRTLPSALFIAAACLGGCAHRAAESTQSRQADVNEVPQAPSGDEVPQGPSLVELRRAAAGIVGCRPEEIVIHDANYAEFHEVWTLTCRSGHWVCSRQDIPFQEYLHCSMLADGGTLGSL